MTLASMWEFWMMCGGVLGAALCILWIYTTKQFLQTASRTTGEVRELVRETDSNGDLYFKPRFAFATPDGEVWSVLSHVGTNPPAFKVGEKITVAYDPRHPGDARIDSVSQLWVLPGTFLAVSVVLALVGGCRLIMDS